MKYPSLRLVQFQYLADASELLRRHPAISSRHEAHELLGHPVATFEHFLRQISRVGFPADEGLLKFNGEAVPLTI